MRRELTPRKRAGGDPLPAAAATSERNGPQPALSVIARAPDEAARVRFAEAVREGLSKPGQKELPSKYLYDAVGSALFEVICLLPEYGLARAGARLLRRYARDIVEPLGPKLVVAELGSGSAKNTRFLLEALARGRTTLYCPIDISATALAQAERELETIDAVSVVGFEHEYIDGLKEASARRKPGEEMFVLFLGGTIGNFDRDAGDAFLRQVRAQLEPADRLLLSTDLEKPVPRLLVAYDDPIGATAAFDLNLLARINRDLDANFDLVRFEHVSRWNSRERRIEMHLRATVAQIVHVRGADLTVSFQAGETIWTESSHKYATAEIPALARRAGFRCESQWIDRDWPFAHNLFIAT